MAKYHYDKKALAGLGIKDFLMEVHRRNEIIEGTPEEDIQALFNVNHLAASLHPHIQFGVIADIREYKDARLYTLKPDREKGCEKLAFFRAGQYIAVLLQIEETVTARPYSICSSPDRALGPGSFYQILVKKNDGGFAAPFIFENWKKGTPVIFSGPLGNFYYQDLRDAKKVVAAAGGSGITPFMAMAEAIADGREHFDLTLLYGCRTEEDILLRDRLEDAAARSDGHVKVRYVLSEEEREGCAHGFITAELISAYGGDSDYSLFACGPDAMYAFLEKQADELGLRKRRVRFEASGGQKASADEGKEYKLTVRVHGTDTETVCREGETLLVSAEKAGIHAPSDCRSGICGWCHARLVSGETYIPEEKDGRRMADRTYGWIHPCVTYPRSDVVMEVYPLY